MYFTKGIFKTIVLFWFLAALGLCGCVLWLSLWSLQVGAALELWWHGSLLQWLLLLWSAGRCNTLSSRGVQALGTGSGVVAHGLSCSLGMWNLAGPGIKPKALQWQAGFYSLTHREVLKVKTFCSGKTIREKKRYY